MCMHIRRCVCVWKQIYIKIEDWRRRVFIIQRELMSAIFLLWEGCDRSVCFFCSVVHVGSRDEARGKLCHLLASLWCYVLGQQLGFFSHLLQLIGGFVINCYMGECRKDLVFIFKVTFFFLFTCFALYQTLFILAKYTTVSFCWEAVAV